MPVEHNFVISGITGIFKDNLTPYTYFLKENKTKTFLF